MSNKLYTEEQVRATWNAAFMEGMSIDSEIYEPVFFENHLNTLTPIELPTDAICVNCDKQKPIHSICMDCIIKIGKQNIELQTDDDIESYVKSTGYYGHCTHEYHEGIEEGAKWMRDKIQGGNNGQ